MPKLKEKSDNPSLLTDSSVDPERSGITMHGLIGFNQTEIEIELWL
jgi:hypothetical protein